MFLDEVTITGSRTRGPLLRYLLYAKADQNRIDVSEKKVSHFLGDIAIQKGGSTALPVAAGTVQDCPLVILIRDTIISISSIAIRPYYYYCHQLQCLLFFRQCGRSRTRKLLYA